MIVFPNVSPLSLLALNTGINTPVLLVHQMTFTLLPEADISVCPLFGALIIIVFNVLPASVLFPKNTF
jgi:hypothetical protein